MMSFGKMLEESLSTNSEKTIIDKVRLTNYVTMIKNIDKALSQDLAFEDDTDEEIVQLKKKMDEEIARMIDEPVENRLFTFVIRDSLKFRKFRVSQFTKTPLALIYGDLYDRCNIYAYIIMHITQFSFTTSNLWKNNDDIFYWMGIGKGTETAKSFVQHFLKSEDITEKYRFLFWALMILTVDKTDAAEHLSLICGYAKMLHVTDDEFDDIIQTIEIIYNQENSYHFKTETIPTYFKRLFDLMEISIDR